jgi:hypothetical protein
MTKNAVTFFSMLINVGHSGGNFMFDNRHRYTLRGGREKRKFIELIKKKK